MVAAAVAVAAGDTEGGAGLLSAATLRVFSLAMALSVVLNITAPDHWRIANPLGLVLAERGHEHLEHAAPRGHHDDGPEHARHCHGDAATCSDLPLTATGGFIALAALLALGGGGMDRSGRASRAPGVPRGWDRAPASPPPRAASPLVTM